MCDIYATTCGKCRKDIFMHLGDFETGRDEIEVYHYDCLRNRREIKRGVLWGHILDDPESGRDEGFVWVIPLTDNAKKNREMNHPNSSYVGILHDDIRVASLRVLRGRKNDA